MASTHGTMGKTRRRFANIGLLLHSHTLAAATTGTVEEALATYVIPKNAFDTNGMGIRVTVHGTTAANANSKLLAVYAGPIGGVAVVISAGAAISAGVIRQEVIIRRASATTINSIGQSVAAATALLTSRIAQTVTNLDTTGLTITVAATTPTAAADFTLRSFMIELLPETPSPADA